MLTRRMGQGQTAAQLLRTVGLLSAVGFFSAWLGGIRNYHWIGVMAFVGFQAITAGLLAGFGDPIATSDITRGFRRICAAFYAGVAPAAAILAFAGKSLADDRWGYAGRAALAGLIIAVAWYTASVILEKYRAYKARQAPTQQTAP